MHKKSIQINIFILSMTITTLCFSQFTSYDRWLIMDDGVHLDATLFIPARPKPPKGFSAIVFVHGLGGNKNKPEIKTSAER